MKMPEKPNVDDMRSLHDNLNQVISASKVMVVNPAVSWSHRQQACRAVVEAVKAKVQLCEIGVWPSAKEI